MSTYCDCCPSDEEWYRQHIDPMGMGISSMEMASAILLALDDGIPAPTPEMLLDIAERVRENDHD